MSFLILFVFGAIIGSFLNVVALRWRSGVGLSGRSFCPHCGKKLFWYELLPIASFAIQKRRCRGCRAKISWEYPGVEIFTGLLFATLYPNVLALVVFSIFVVVVVYDVRHKIIPDELVYSAIALSLLGRWFSGGSTLDWLAGPIIFAFFALLWLFSKGRAVGFGDAKLGLSLGLLLGAQHGFSAVALAFWIGAGTTLAYMVIFPLLRGGKRLTMKSEVPFAPFMVLAAWLAIIYDLNILQIP